MTRSVSARGLVKLTRDRWWYILTDVAFFHCPFCSVATRTIVARFLVTTDFIYVLQRVLTARSYHRRRLTQRCVL